MTKSSNEQGFFEKPRNIQWILRIFYGLCVFFVLMDFVVHRHVVTAIEKLPAFYAFVGFGTCVVWVFLAKQMRKLVMRNENYYDEHKQPTAKQQD